MSNQAFGASGPDLAGSAETLAGLSAAMAEAASRGRQTYEAAAAAWTQEVERFFEDMVRDGAAAVEQLKRSRSPLDVLAAEQAWLMARSKAYVESGARLYQTYIDEARQGMEQAGAAGQPSR